MPRIDRMFAFIVADKGPDDEGVVARHIGGQWFPLIGADMERVDSMLPFAQQLADSQGKTIEVVEFVGRRRLLLLEPRRAKG